MCVCVCVCIYLSVGLMFQCYFVTVFPDKSMRLGYFAGIFTMTPRIIEKCL